MTQVLLVFDNDTQEVDLALDSRGFISLEGGFETSSLISMHTNKRALPSDEEAQPYGWWGDSFARVEGDQIGSHLWKLRRSNLTVETIRKSKLYLDAAFRWYVEDGIATSVEVETERQDPETIAARVRINRPKGEPWQHVWEIHVNAI